MSVPPPTVKMRIRKLDLYRKFDEVIEDEVAVESPIEILLNGESIATLLATPSMIEELAVGFLIDEGIVERWSNIVEVCAMGKTVDVKTGNASDGRGSLKNLGLILTSCGPSAYARSVEGRNWPTVDSELRIGPEDITQMISGLTRSSRHFSKTGATHSAAIFHENAMRCFAEDVGRHNAIDKVIGHSLKQGLDLERVVLVTTGRQPADLVLKAARVGIPILVSMRGPIYSGVVAAERAGLTLVCFARGPRMNIYTRSERILC